MATVHPFASHRPALQPLYLPPLSPISPFVVHFDIFAGRVRRRRSGQQPASPSTPTPSPSYDDHPPLALSHAVKGSRTTADLIRIMDLTVGLAKIETVDSRELTSVSSPNTIPVNMATSGTPDTSLTTPDASPLTRANMSKLRDATRTPKRGRSPRTPTSPGSSVARERMVSPIRIASPPRAASKRSTVGSQSSYGPIRSARSEDLHLMPEPLDAALTWPTSEGVGLPDSMSQLSLYAGQPSSAPERHHDSFMHFGSRNGSDTFNFPAPAATETESDYSPSMAAPSSVRRRVAKWTSSQEAVPEEDESDNAAHLVRHRSPPAPLALSLGSHAPMDDALSPNKSFRTTSSLHRVSEISGDTFGRHMAQRAVSMQSDPMVAETFADLDRVRDELLADGTISKRAPEPLAGARQSASGVSSEAHGVESDEAITAHLLQAAAVNDRRIVPADPQTPIGPSGRSGFPPEFYVPMLVDDPTPCPASPRSMAKIDQVLGRGAYEAGMSMEHDRRLLRDALAKSVIGPVAPGSLPPRPGQHKASASVPLLSSANTMELPPTHQRFGEGTPSRLPRTGSLESITASLADSITRLIPPPLPPKPNDMRPANMNRTRTTPADIESRNELSAEQRQTLLRRVRVLEKRLGEPLREDQTGRWVVQPSVAIDVTGDESSARHARSQSSLQRIKEAFGLDRVEELEVVKTVEPSRRDSLDVALLRTLTVDSLESVDVDDSMRAQRRRQIAKLNKMLGTIVHPSHLDRKYVPPTASALRLPAVFTPDTIDEISFIEMDAPQMSSRRSSDSSGTKDTWTSKIRQTMGKRSSSNKEISGIRQDQSFFDMSGDGGWRRHKPSASSPGDVVLSEGNAVELSSAEKTQMRKKAKKLSQKFGEAPPQGLYHPAATRRRTQTPDMKLERGMASMVSISQSLRGLVYLAENNPSKLDQIVDDLAEDSPDSSRPESPDMSTSPPLSPPRPYRASTSSSFEVYAKSPSPMTPPRSAYLADRVPSSPSPGELISPDAEQMALDPHSHDARRRRSGKLSEFFGEVIDFERPPPLPPKRKSKKEVLNGILGEMWSAVQLENRRGVLAIEDMDRVGAMIAAVRRSQQ